MARRDPRPLLAQLAKERDEARAELEQARYETTNLREILQAYQEHVSAARRPSEAAAGEEPGARREDDAQASDALREQLSVASSRNAVLSAELEAKTTEAASLRDIMGAMREDLRKAAEKQQAVETEHDERLGLIAEQLESLKKNARRARVERRAAERRMTESQQETELLKEQLAAQDAELARQEKGASAAQDAALERDRQELADAKAQLVQSGTRLAWTERLLQRGEVERMGAEDRAAQRAEIYMLEAELRAIRKAEADERAEQAVQGANTRARQAEQAAAQENAARVRAETERDTALRQLAIIQERFGVADRKGLTYGYHGQQRQHSPQRRQQRPQRSNYGTASGDDMPSSEASDLEQRFKMIGASDEDLRAALLLDGDSPLLLPVAGDLQGMGPYGQKKKGAGSDGCCCVVS